MGKGGDGVGIDALAKLALARVNVLGADADASNVDDPLRAQARNLIQRFMDEAFYLLENGTPQVRQGLIKAIVPSLIRALREEHKVSDEVTEMRQEMNALMAVVRERITGAGSVIDTALIPEDMPQGATLPLDAEPLLDRRGLPVKPPPVIRRPQSRGADHSMHRGQGKERDRDGT